MSGGRTKKLQRTQWALADTAERLGHSWTESCVGGQEDSSGPEAQDDNGQRGIRVSGSYVKTPKLS